METKKEINSLLEKLIEQSTNDRKLLNSLKSLAVKSGSFELAAKLKDLERLHFTESKEISELKTRADLIKRCFAIIDIPINEKTAMIILLITDLTKNKMDDSSLKELAYIKAQVDNIYPEL